MKIDCLTTTAAASATVRTADGCQAFKRVEHELCNKHFLHFCMDQTRHARITDVPYELPPRCSNGVFGGEEAAGVCCGEMCTECGGKLRRTGMSQVKIATLPFVRFERQGL